MEHLGYRAHLSITRERRPGRECHRARTAFRYVGLQHICGQEPDLPRGAPRTVCSCPDQPADQRSIAARSPVAGGFAPSVWPSYWRVSLSGARCFAQPARAASPVPLFSSSLPVGKGCAAGDGPYPNLLLAGGISATSLPRLVQKTQTSGLHPCNYCRNPRPLFALR